MVTDILLVKAELHHPFMLAYLLYLKCQGCVPWEDVHRHVLFTGLGAYVSYTPHLPYALENACPL